MRDNFTDIFLVVAKQPCFGQRDQVLVAVQLPRDFVITDHGEVEEGNLEPGIERCALFVDAVQVPVDLGAIIYRVIAQQTKMMAADIVSLVQDFQGLVGQMLAKESGAILRFAVREEKFGPVRQTSLDANGRRWPAQSMAGEVDLLVEFLSSARADFLPVHVRQSRQLVLRCRGHR